MKDFKCQTQPKTPVKFSGQSNTWTWHWGIWTCLWKPLLMTQIVQEFLVQDLLQKFLKCQQTNFEENIEVQKIQH